jgi:hypothetical protein
VPWAAPLVLLGDVVLLDVTVLLGVAALVVPLLDDEAALAIAAPPPVRAAVTASVVSSGRTLRCKSFTSWLWGDPHHAPRTSQVRRRRRRVRQENRRTPGGPSAAPAGFQVAPPLPRG